MVHYESDYQYGIAKQKEIFPILKDYFGGGLMESKNKWAKFDFYDESSLYELKSRKVKKSTYPTTIITANKNMSNCNRDDKKVVFVFNFIDEICFVEYNAESFSKYETQQFSRAEIDSDLKEHYHIPINDLKTIRAFR
jgi:hypothetical protein